MCGGGGEGCVSGGEGWRSVMRGHPLPGHRETRVVQRLHGQRRSGPKEAELGQGYYDHLATVKDAVRHLPRVRG